MTDLQVTITQFSIHRKNENPIYGEDVIRVNLEDEAAGFFITLSQPTNTDMRITIEELELIAQEAKKMVDLAEKHLQTNEQRNP